MTVRPPEESLEPGITKILSGIELFSEAVTRRYYADDPWHEDHLRDLSELDSILTDLKYRLHKLKRDTW